METAAGMLDQDAAAAPTARSWRRQRRAMVMVEAAFVVLVVAGAVVWKVSGAGPKPLPIGRLSLAAPVSSSGVVCRGGSRCPIPQPGAKVRIWGQPITAGNRRWPVVRVVVPQSEIVHGSASVSAVSPGGTPGPALAYSLDARGAEEWCKFTTRYVHYNSPVVLGNIVIADPTVQSPICGGQTELTGLKASQASEVEAEINS